MWASPARRQSLPGCPAFISAPEVTATLAFSESVQQSITSFTLPDGEHSDYQSSVVGTVPATTHTVWSRLSRCGGGKWHLRHRRASGPLLQPRHILSAPSSGPARPPQPARDGRLVAGNASAGGPGPALQPQEVLIHIILSS